MSDVLYVLHKYMICICFVLFLCSRCQIFPPCLGLKIRYSMRAWDGSLFQANIVISTSLFQAIL